MSQKAEKKNNKKYCRMCGERKALYISRGRVRRDRFHDLCWKCWRSLLDRYREV